MWLCGLSCCISTLLSYRMSSLLPQPGVPKSLHLFSHRIHCHRHYLFPLPGEHSAIRILPETLIQQDDNPHIFRGPDDTSRRLQDFIHSGITVGIIKAVFPIVIKIVLEDFPFTAYLWQSGSYYDNTDEAVLFQVDPLSEYTSKHA